MEGMWQGIPRETGVGVGVGVGGQEVKLARLSCLNLAPSGQPGRTQHTVPGNRRNLDWDDDSSRHGQTE